MLGLDFPGGQPVTFLVACSVGAGVTSEHPVTIGPAPTDDGWVVDTGHDLAAERIAVALGGARVSCLDVVESAVPAIQAYWDNLRRDALVGIRPSARGRREGTSWVVVEPVVGCECGYGGWEHPEEAAAHLRGLPHWCRMRGASPGGTERLLRRLARVTGEAVWAQHRWPPADLGREVEQYTDLFRLWEAGVHPDLVRDIHSKLGLSDPLSGMTYLNIATREIDLKWLARFASGGPHAVAWAASTYGRRDVNRPDDRLEWYLAGLHFKVISELLESAYSLDDVRALADATDVSLSAAGHVIADWLAADCKPTLTQLIQVCRLVPRGRQAPSDEAITAVIRRTALARGEMSRTAVGLILVAEGTPTGAVALIKRGVRTLDDFEQWQTMGRSA